MKQLITCLTLILCALTITPSCKKDNSSINNSQTINVTIQANEDYQYDLGLFGDEEGATINCQATHFNTSIIERDLSIDKVTYKYKPSPGYIGTDEVELKSERGSDGASPNDKIIITTIKFTITN